MVHLLQEHHSKICYNEKTQAHYAHNPFHYYDCFATILYLEETSFTLMCNPSALGQSSLWMAAKQNHKTRKIKHGSQNFGYICNIKSWKQQHSLPAPFRGQQELAFTTFFLCPVKKSEHNQWGIKIWFEPGITSGTNTDIESSIN